MSKSGTEDVTAHRDAGRGKYFRRRMRNKQNLPEPSGRARLEAGPRSARATGAAPEEPSHERRACFRTLADGRSQNEFSPTQLQTRTISEPPSQIPF